MKKLKLIIFLLLGLSIKINAANNVPNFFIPNEGQLLYHNGELAKDVLYYSSLGNGVTMLFKKDRISYVVKKENREKTDYYNEIGESNSRLADSLYLQDSSYYYQMDLVFLEASSSMHSQLNNTSKVFNQYIFPHCKEGIKVNPSGELIYTNIYPNIDIKFYTKNNGLKYDIILRPGSNIDDVQLKYIGADLNIIKEKIKIKTPIKSWSENIPVSYLTGEKEENKTHEKIEVNYNLKGNLVSFNAPSYDRSKTLVIDPDLTWSTYYNVKQQFNWVYQSADSYNDKVVMATRVDNTIAPLLIAGSGAYIQNTLAGNYDFMLLMFNVSGQLEWATYFGGSDFEYLKGGVKFDNNGKIYFVGQTRSTDMPIQSLAGAYSGVRDGTTFEEIFVSRFSNTGVYEWGTFIPTDFYAGEVGIDVGPNNNLFLAGSFPLDYGFGTAFPMTNPGGGAYFQASRTDGSATTSRFNDESFIVEFSSSCQLVWSTYFGNNANEEFKEIKVAPNGTIFTSGVAPARYADPVPAGGGYVYFPPILQSAGQFYDNDHQNGANKLYITKFNTNRSLSWATYYGNNSAQTQSYYQSYGHNYMQINSSNELYLVGGTTDANMPTLSLGGAYNQNATTVNASGTKVFILKFANNTQLQWATYFSGAQSNGYWRVGSYLDHDDELYIVAGTPNSDHPTLASTGYFKGTREGNKDGIISRFSSAGALLWSTYFGGPYFDDEVKQVVVTGSTTCYDKQIFVFGRTGDDGSGGDSWPIVDPGGGAHIQGFPGSEYYQVGIARFGVGLSQPPVTNTTSTTSICETGTKALTASPGGGVWSVVSGGGSISGTTYTAPTVASNTSVTIKYKILATGGCPADSANVTFTVTDNIPANNTTTTTSICETATKALTGTPAGGSWSVVSGGGSISGTTYTPANITANTSVTIKYKTLGSGSCPADSANVTFTVEPTITPSITSSAADMCNGDTRALTGTPSGGTWSVVSGPGSITGTTLTATGSGTIQVRYRIVNACGNNDATQNITVSNSIAVSAVASASSLCENLTRTMSGIPSGGAWNVLNGPGTITGGVLTPSGLGTVEIEYAVTSSCGNGADTIDVVINPVPNASAGVDENICTGDTVILTATGGGTYQWNPGSAGANNQVYPSVTTGYRVDVTSDSGCVASDSVTVFVQSTGVATAQNDQATVTTGIQETIDIYSNDVGGINSLQLLNGPSHGTASISGGNIIYTSTAGYIGIDSIFYEICDANCGVVCDTAYLVITVENDLTIPIGISPNGDGKNDVFNILGLSKYSTNHLYIYNRWGSLVYEAQPYLNDWSGESKNGELIEGTYFYVLKLGEELPSYNGYIELKK